MIKFQPLMVRAAIRKPWIGLGMYDESKEAQVVDILWNSNLDKLEEFGRILEPLFGGNEVDAKTFEQAKDGIRTSAILDFPEELISELISFACLC